MAPPVILLVIHSTYTTIPIHPPDIFLSIPFFSFLSVGSSIMYECIKMFCLIYLNLQFIFIAVSHVTTCTHIIQFIHTSWICFSLLLTCYAVEVLSAMWHAGKEQELVRVNGKSEYGIHFFLRHTQIYLKGVYGFSIHLHRLNIQRQYISVLKEQKKFLFVCRLSTYSIDCVCTRYNSTTFVLH